MPRHCGPPGRGERLVWAGLAWLACVTGCPGDSSEGTAATCDVAAENLIEVCAAFIGEDFRALCEAESLPLVTQAVRDCVAELDECSEEAAEQCGVRSVTIACAADHTCPSPFVCDATQAECVRCLEDADCAAGRGCLSGLCFDKDSDHYKAFKGLFEGDAGPASR